MEDLEHFLNVCHLCPEKDPPQFVPVLENRLEKDPSNDVSSPIVIAGVELDVSSAENCWDYKTEILEQENKLLKEENDFLKKENLTLKENHESLQDEIKRIKKQILEIEKRAHFGSD